MTRREKGRPHAIRCAGGVIRCVSCSCWCHPRPDGWPMRDADTGEAFDYAGAFEVLQMFSGMHARQLETVELDRLETILDRSHSVGAILDPTAYRTAISDGRLDFQRRVIAAATAFRESMRELRRDYPQAFEAAE